MALSFNCGQYEQGFDSRRLQNWELRNKHRRRPLAKGGFTQVISNDRGHLLPSQPRPARSPWGTFVGTWDLPKKLPGNKQTDPTARSAQAHMRCTGEKAEADDVIYGRTKMRRAQAGQPLQAMPHYAVDPEKGSTGARSGAENPLIKGTPPQRATPVTRISPVAPINMQAHPPLDMSNTCQPAPIEEQIDSELLAPAQVRPSSSHSIPRTPKGCSPLPPISNSAYGRRATPTLDMGQSSQPLV